MPDTKDYKHFTEFKKGDSEFDCIERCDAHMNELPVPCGSWDLYYRDQQAYYSKTLIAGAVWFVASFALMIGSGSLFLNWSPPTQPGAPSDMVEECHDED